jgi:hypothetical protein
VADLQKRKRTEKKPPIPLRHRGFYIFRFL